MPKRGNLCFSFKNGQCNIWRQNCFKNDKMCRNYDKMCLLHRVFEDDITDLDRGDFRGVARPPRHPLRVSGGGDATL